MHLRWTWGAVLGIILMTLACGGSGAEARARSCFEALSQGNMDVTMQCMASDRRERFADESQEAALALLSNGGYVQGTRYDRYKDREVSGDA